MLARLLGRSSSNQSQKKEETPEVDVRQISINKKKEDEPITSNPNEDNENNNNEINEHINVNEINLELIEKDNQNTKITPTPCASGWVYPFESKTNNSWPQNLNDVLPENIRKKLDSKIILRTPLDIRMNHAQLQRQNYLNQIQDLTSDHNQRVAYLAKINKDRKCNSLIQQKSKTNEKIQEASQRREQILAEKRQICNYLAYPAVYENHDNLENEKELNPYERQMEYELLHQSRQKRYESAIRFRDLIIKEISRRAGKEVERARLVATDLANAQMKKSENRELLLTERLNRAEVRRSILIDRKRLSAGRHSNYVKSVYLTTKYMERRSAQMIQHNIESASFRRDVHLEEIKSNARQQNLSAQFRTSCAYRLLDAKWLNYALKTTTAQTNAKMKRDSALEALQNRLHDAKTRRDDVLATHQKLQAQQRSTLAFSEAKINKATERREFYLFQRVHRIQERSIEISARKGKRDGFSRKLQRKHFRNKLESASIRRLAYIERRRSTCATRNWHAKLLADQMIEQYEEAQAIGLHRFEQKILSAESRKKETMRPIFAELVALRVVRARQVNLARSSINARVCNRKEAFSRLRISAIQQDRCNQAMNRMARVKRVQSNREFMDNFYKQVISNTTLARQRGAELRRSLYIDAVQACAIENRERSQIAQEKLEKHKKATANTIEHKMRSADAKRQEKLSERTYSAHLFLSKVASTLKKVRYDNESQRLLLEEKLGNADLRRAIYLTQTAQSNAQRKTRKDLQNEHNEKLLNDLKRSYKEKAENSELRRREFLLRKVENAKCISNRVATARLEKKAEYVVDAAIRTALQKTMTRNAAERRNGHIEDIQSQAATQVNYARGVAKYQKELHQVRAEVKLEQSKLRMLQTSKRRENLMSQRKMGQSTMEQLKPYAGLQVVGHSVPLLPYTA